MAKRAVEFAAAVEAAHREAVNEARRSGFEAGVLACTAILESLALDAAQAATSYRVGPQHAAKPPEEILRHAAATIRERVRTPEA